MTSVLPCALSCEAVCAGYGDPVREAMPILRGVSLSLAGGELAVIVGPNGGGKTTLIRVLSGLLTPTSGVARLGGRAVASLSARERAGCVAVVSQRAVAPECSVREVVLMGRYARLPWHALYDHADHIAVEDAMHQTGIQHLAVRRADTLSGGEWQRVLLARALAQGADTLLLDEPATGLDPGRVIELFDLLAARRAAGAAVLAVLHDINLAALYATRLIGLSAGRILFDGSPKNVLTSGHLHALYGIAAAVFSHPVTGAPQVCWTPGADVGRGPADGHGRGSGSGSAAIRHE